MRVGITLPQFRDDAEPALAVARAAEAVGLDGVFVFDHLWPLGQPDRPALHSHVLLGALSAETERVTLGPLVARMGLVPNAVLVHALATLHRMLGPRLLATLGTGDAGNRAENEAYGVGYAPAAERVAALLDCLRRLRAGGVPTWVGGRSRAVRRAALESDGWNRWGVDAATFAAEVAAFRELGPLRSGHAGPPLRSGHAGPPLRSVHAGPEVSWGGQVLVGRTEAEAAEKLARIGARPALVHGTVADLTGHLAALADAGASWAVCAPLDVGTDPETVELVAEAAAPLR
ncbi:MAG TPA: LLM class flavin-dependent oxidoreductase [Acidimicrobiales bacterium]|nr:LLM class flavin-dependent oxidoreductase [Acidimicrobiales bacterium]